ncbi:Potassium transporter [Knufia fluminis]|uniref:Potassium transporter n=1 Tax=Knufia fluminis TaxID=191047 RepID=A0AAN8EAA0_9EURO|nr:Potassium transporter [Knufia fluminis]
MKNDVKWEYVNLNDFKSSSCFTVLAYVYLWIMLFVSISVYAVDTFTAINLLAFNQWAGQIKPAIDLKYSRWIFAGCIILSFVLLIYRWLRALKVMRGGKIAKAYLDPLAVRVEAIRMGKEGRGWKRFLVFAELTKSRKGADYVALFAYYSFEAWLRIVFAEGPRQVINGITLYAYAEASLVPKGDHDTPQGESPFVQFWKNFAILAEEDKLQMAIIIGMLWTVLIWIISALSLAVSVVLYLIFLWHHIPSDAGGLSGYCRTKINRRMERIVRTKTDKALKKENELRAREEAQAFRTGAGDFKRQPTLPVVVNGSTPTLPSLSRQTTTTTLPEYTSRPGTAAPSEEMIPPMPSVTPIDSQARPGPRRHMTNASDASWSSYNSNAPLMNSAGDMGYSPADRFQTPISGASTPWSARPGATRNLTDNSQFTDRSYTPGPPRPGTSQSNRGPSGNYPMELIGRPGTGMSNRPPMMRHSSDSDTLPPPRGMSPLSAASSHAPMLPDPQRTRTPASNYDAYFPPVSPIPEYGGRESPAFTAGAPSRSHTPMGPPPRMMTPGHAPPLPRLHTPAPATSNGSGYVAFNPNADRTASPAPYRSFTAPNMPQTETPTSATDGYRSFSRPFSGQSGNQTPYDQVNLYPPKPLPPPRAGSFDDILDHY